MLGDESYFDTRRTAPGWRPSYYKIESPPLSALVVDRAKVNGRTVDDPALAAASAFRTALVGGRGHGRRQGGRRPRRPGRDDARDRHAPAPCPRLVRQMNKISDNFSAEMLVKHLGAVVPRRGTTTAGCIVVRRELDEPRRARSPASGSPTAPASRSSTGYRRALVAAARLRLARPGRAAAVRRLARRSPAWTGRSRTACARAPARGRVRAKTGTTSDRVDASPGTSAPATCSPILQNGQPDRLDERPPRAGPLRAGPRADAAVGPASREELLEGGLVEDLDAGLLGLLELRARALADDDAGGLLRDRVGDLGAQRLERGPAPPRATGARASR